MKHTRFDRKFDRLQAPSGAPSLHRLLSRSPLNRVEFEHDAIAGPVREVAILNEPTVDGNNVNAAPFSESRPHSTSA